MLGPVSPSPMRLKSRAGASGSAVSPSQIARTDSSRAVQELLDHDRREAEPALDEHHLQRFQRLRLVGRDHDALPGRQPVGLDDSRVAGDRLDPVRHGLDHRVAAGRHARGGHHLLGERLRALEPRSGGARPEAGDAGGRAVVGQARDQRRLGADHDQVDPGEVDLGDHRRVLRDPGVAGRTQHLGVLRGPVERANDRVLAAAPAHHEDARHSDAMKSSIGIAASDS